MSDKRICRVSDDNGHICEREVAPYPYTKADPTPVINHVGVHRDNGYWWLGTRRRTTKVGSQKRLIPSE